MSRAKPMLITQRASAPALQAGDYTQIEKRPQTPLNVLRRPLRLPPMEPVKRCG